MSIADEIRKLAELRDAGQLTEDEFQAAKARLLAGGQAGAVAEGAASGPDASALSRLRRSANDRWIGGVCGGLARWTNSESWIWRLLFVVTTFFAGFGPLLYILLWIFVPSEDKA